MTLGNYGHGPYRVTVRNRDRDDTCHVRFTEVAEAANWLIWKRATAGPGDEVYASPCVEEAADVAPQA